MIDLILLQASFYISIITMYLAIVDKNIYFCSLGCQRNYPPTKVIHKSHKIKYTSRSFNLHGTNTSANQVKIFDILD